MGGSGWKCMFSLRGSRRRNASNLVPSCRTTRWRTWIGLMTVLGDPKESAIGNTLTIWGFALMSTFAPETSCGNGIMVKEAATTMADTCFSGSDDRDDEEPVCFMINSDGGRSFLDEEWVWKGWYPSPIRSPDGANPRNEDSARMRQTIESLARSNSYSMIQFFCAHPDDEESAWVLSRIGPPGG